MLEKEEVDAVSDGRGVKEQMQRHTVEMVQNTVALAPAQPLNLGREPLIHKNRLPLGQRMRANHRMQARVRPAPNFGAERILPVQSDEMAMGVGMICREAFEEGFVGGREPVVGGVAGDPEGVAADWGDLGDFEDGVGGWFGFVGYVA